MKPGKYIKLYFILLVDTYINKIISNILKNKLKDI